MTYNATAVGLLTGHFRHSDPPPDGSVWAGNLQRFEQTMTPAADRVVETLMSITAERGRTPAQIAIAWILSRPGISSAMIGPDASAHVDENIGGVGWQLADEERRKLDEASAWAVTDGQIA